jgi:hypothetical protein
MVYEMSSSFQVFNQKPMHFSYISTCTKPSHFISLHLTFLTTFSNEYKVWSSSLWNYCLPLGKNVFFWPYSQTASVYILPCGSLPQWSECYQIGAHVSSYAHWSTRHLVKTSDKSIKMQPSGAAASVTATFTSRQCSSEPTPPVIASTYQANNCSRSFTGPPASPLSLALASHCYKSITRHPAGTPAHNHRATTRRVIGASTD